MKINKINHKIQILTISILVLNNRMSKLLTNFNKKNKYRIKIKIEDKSK
mgnify:CR=1 FL=1|jgi:hypothetical protein